MSKLDRLRWAVSVESVSGIKQRELEYTFYGCVKSWAELEQASVHTERQEQWAVPIDTDKPGKARIRAINGERFVLTTKFRYPEALGVEEVECDISKDMFIHLKAMAQGGYLKTRYTIPVTGTELKWEIDVFLDATGARHPWVKVDLEVPNAETPLPKLPIDFVEFISHQSKALTDAEQATVDSLWGSEWSCLDRVVPDIAE